MNLIESVKTCFKKYGVIEGRASRSEYWFFILFYALISLPLEFFAYENLNIAIIELIITIGFLIPTITVATRRLHDVNRSGWWQLISFTIIGIIPLLYWLCKNSDEENNRFGSNPLK